MCVSCYCHLWSSVPRSCFVNEYIKPHIHNPIDVKHNHINILSHISQGIQENQLIQVNKSEPTVTFIYHTYIVVHALFHFYVLYNWPLSFLCGKVHSWTVSLLSGGSKHRVFLKALLAQPCHGLRGPQQRNFHGLFPSDMWQTGTLTDEWGMWMPWPGMRKLQAGD